MELNVLDEFGSPGQSLTVYFEGRSTTINFRVFVDEIEIREN